MKKYIFTLIAVLLFSSAAFGVASNRVYYQIQVINELGDNVTSPAITQIDVQNESGTAVAVYSTKFGTTEVGSTGVITSGLADGRTEFWYAGNAIDLTVTDGTRSYEIESYSVRDHTFMLARFIPALSGSDLGETDDLDFTYASWVLDGDTLNRLDMIPDNDAATMAIGDTTTQADVYIYSDSTSDYWLFDEGAGEVYYENLDLQFGDNDLLYFGANNDAQITYDETTDDNLEITAASVGVSLTTNDFLATLDGVAADQWKIDATGTIDGDAINFETTNGGIMLNADGADYGDIEANAADDLILTAGGDVILTAGGDISVTDDDTFSFGTDDDIAITFDSSGSDLNIIGSGFEIAIGEDSEGIDVYIYGETTGEYFFWDESLDYLHVIADKTLYTLTGTTLPVRIDATGTVSSGNAIELETTSGPIQILADGASTGDITLDAEDDIILTTTGTLTITNTDAVTISGAFEPDIVHVPDGAAYDVLANNSGQIHIIPDQTADITLDLPAEADGLHYRFVYVGGAADAQDWTIDSEDDTNFFIGGVVQHDSDDAGDDTVTYYSDGDSNSILGVLTPGAGTVIEIWCDGTNWYLTGTVISATDTGVTFADKS